MRPQLVVLQPKDISLFEPLGIDFFEDLFVLEYFVECSIAKHFMLLIKICSLLDFNLIKLVTLGMNPDPDKHELIFYLNPTIGTPVFADFRLQVNIATRSHPFLPGFGDVPKSIYPLLWIEGGVFPNRMLDFVLIGGLNALVLVDYGPYLLLLGGLAFLGLSSLIALKDRQRLFKASPRLTPLLSHFDPMVRHVQNKAHIMYPNLFTVTDGIRAEPSLSRQSIAESRHEIYINRSAPAMLTTNHQNRGLRNGSSLPDVY